MLTFPGLAGVLGLQRCGMDGQSTAFGDLLRRYRKRAGLTQESLAERAGISARSVGNIERGAPYRSRRLTVASIADVLALSMPEREAFERSAEARFSPGHTDAPTKAPTVLAPRNNLPSPPTALVGRTADVRAARDLLAGPDGRLLTLTGPAGVGKTRLALAVASDLLPRYRDGVWFVDLAPLTDATQVAPAVARVMGAPDLGDLSSLAPLRAYLDERAALLLLDNLEHLTGAATLVADLLSSAAEIRVLATSREALRLRWERRYPVAPLPVPDLDRLPALDVLARSPAVDLFVQRARHVSPGFALTDTDAAAVAAICARLDGLPLAIELAAVQVSALPPTALLDRLDHDLPSLGWDAHDLPERHRTLGAAIAWSYDLLTAPEQTLLRRVGVPVGGFADDAAAALVDPTGGETRVALERLVECNLVRAASTADGDRRYALLETVRAFALGRLGASGEEPDVRRRHAEHYLALAEGAAPGLDGGSQAASLARIDREHDNLRAALGWAETAGPTGAVLGARIASALWRFWLIRGHLSEGRRWMERWLGEPAIPADLRAGLALGAGRLARQQGDLAAAAEYLGKALALRRALGDRLGSAPLLGYLGVVAYDRGDFTEAAELHTESLVLRRELGDTGGIAGTLTNLGEVARQRGDYSEAVSLHAESLALFRELGDRWGAALALTNLGTAYLQLGDPGRAGAHLREGLALQHALGDRAGLAETLEALAVVRVAEGRPAEAARMFGAATALRDIVGVPRPIADRPSYQSAVAQVRAALGPVAFGAAWASGNDRPTDDLVVDLVAGHVVDPDQREPVGRRPRDPTTSPVAG